MTRRGDVGRQRTPTRRTPWSPIPGRLTEISRQFSRALSPFGHAPSLWAPKPSTRDRRRSAVQPLMRTFSALPKSKRCVSPRALDESRRSSGGCLGEPWRHGTWWGCLTTVLCVSLDGSSIATRQDCPESQPNRLGGDSRFSPAVVRPVV